MKQSKGFWITIAAGIVLFAIHASADYLLQAYQHGWVTWLDLHGRAAEWPWYLDVLPRDLWHAVQTIRNNSVIAATVVICLSAGLRIDPDERFSPWAWAINFLIAPFLLYGLTRAIFFSLVKELLN